MSTVPDNANESCPGTESENAGKTGTCAGCPNQKFCASGEKPVDPDVEFIKQRLSSVKNKILILSGKGGVGKSSVTTNLAIALAEDPKIQVGVLDVDICGPSQARLFNVEDETVHDSASGWSPVSVKDNLVVMSIAFLLESRSNAVVWRGPRKNAMIKKFLKDVDWGQMDYLLIDTPPGTSDEHISIVQLLLEASTVNGALIVTTPQEISLLDVRKEINFCQKTKLPILGIIENMSSFICPCCQHETSLFPPTSGGAEKMAKELGLELLSKLPQDPRLASALDHGEDFLEKHPDSAAAKALKELALKMSHRVVVTGLGTVSPYGVGVKRLWDGLRQNTSGLKYNDRLGLVVGEVPRGEEEGQFNINEYAKRDQREMSMPTLLTLKAVEEALQDAGILEAEKNFHENTSVNIGMGIADLEEICRTGALIEGGKERQVGPYFVPKILTNIPAGYVALRYRFNGGNSSSSTACATGLTCLAESFAQIQAGRVRRAVAGSVESCLNKISIVGFQRMRALASKTENLDEKHYSVSRPFDVHRNGFTLSEGAGVMVLERYDDAKHRGANIYAEILGYGISNDAYHLTSPSPDGLASEMSMRRCLQDSQLSSEDVQYVNAHATSTKAGDKAEALSVSRLFMSNVALSSLKGHIGHCVSAAGSVEGIATVLALKNGEIPPTLNLKDSDVGGAVDLVKGNWRMWPVAARRVVIKNSFGFGGAFISLAFAQL